MRIVNVLAALVLIAPGAHHVSAQSIPAPPPGYQTLLANVSEGKKLYLRTTLSHIGTIAGVADAHRLADGSTRQGVLVRFKDGSFDWPPRKTVHFIYVTKRD